MPELPEVETIRRSLALRLEGCRITNVEVGLERLIKWPVINEFYGLVEYKKVIKVDRRGKYLLLLLEDNNVLVVHLRMTGRLCYQVNGASVKDRFARIIFNLDNGDSLVYADTRTLGTLYAMPIDELWRIKGLAEMGPEPVSDEFTLEYFTKILYGRRGSIKALLLNQKFIGGLGNIYVDEALAMANVDPARVAGTLSAMESEKLFAAIRKVILAGIEHSGTTFRDYRDGEGRSGNHQNHLLVYGRKGLPCINCGTRIERKETAGRGTHYCPNCQK